MYFYFMCTRVLLHYVFVPHSWSVCGGQKRALDPWELELEVIVGYHVSAGNEIQVICKPKECFKPPIQLSKSELIYTSTHIDLEYI